MAIYGKRKFHRIFFVLTLFLAAEVVESRRHRLNIHDDSRKSITCSTFGFTQGGYLSVTLSGFRVHPDDVELDDHTFGFTLDKTYSKGISPYLQNKEDSCPLEDASLMKDAGVSMIFFRFDFKNKQLTVERKGADLTNIPISTLNESAYVVTLREGRSTSSIVQQSSMLMNMRNKRDTANLPSGGVPNAAPNGALAAAPAGAKAVDGAAASDTANIGGANAKPTDGTENAAAQPNAAAQNPPVPNAQNPTISSPVSTTKASVVTEKVQVGANPTLAPGVTTTPKTETTTKSEASQKLSNLLMPVNKSMPLKIIDGNINVHFLIAIKHDAEVGLYNLIFHNCANLKSTTRTSVNFTLNITEKNAGSYLSAGEIPLPPLCFVFCAIFFITGCFWWHVLRTSTSGSDVFKIHYLMLVLVYVKAAAFLFHGINYHFIGKEGYQEEGWAVVYYITHLMKGALLFITIVLIGAGWAFIKHMLSDKEKKVFLIVIPLQVLANVAQIIIEESEEGAEQYTTWKEVFILVDLLCCGAILFPVVWSIRHLHEASQTDGKAAINLLKLKLFRHFYIMVVCYIYFTRIIVYLLRITVPFQYEWLDQLFRESATYIFFVVTGYKFQPVTNNPYLQVPEEDEDEIEMDEVLTQSGALETVSKVMRVNVTSSDNGQAQPSIKQRESSHEYD